jgi:hypothetical protein
MILRYCDLEPDLTKEPKKIVIYDDSWIFKCPNCDKFIILDQIHKHIIKNGYFIHATWNSTLNKFYVPTTYTRELVYNMKNKISGCGKPIRLTFNEVTNRTNEVTNRTNEVTNRTNEVTNRTNEVTNRSNRTNAGFLETSEFLFMASPSKFID